MKFDFETRVDRKGYGSMRQIILPANVENAGLLSYNGAEMEFLTAPSIVESITKRAAQGAPSFTLCDAPYRQAVCWWMKTQRNLEIAPEWIVATHGTIFTLATLIRMFVAEGESIIIQTPTYNRYEQAAQRLGRNTIKNPLLFDGEDYHIDFTGLEQAMARQDTKLLVLCNPNNPTGNIWDEGTLKRIADMADRHGVFVYCDEIFAEICFGTQCPSYAAITGAEANSVTVTSIGKCFNFTGVNHANVLIRDEALREAFRKQRDADHYGSMDPWAYSAVMGAYTLEGAAWKDAMKQQVLANMRYLAEFFHRNFPAVQVHIPQASFVMWVDWSGLGLDEKTLLQFLQNEALFDISPGEEYYEDRPCMTRISVAVPQADLARSLDKLLSAAKARGLA